MNLTEFQIAVINDDRSEVAELLMELDRRTEREHFRRAAAEFGFRLLEHRGKCHAMRRELAPLLGYMDESGLRKLCEKYEIEGVSLGAFGPEVRMFAQENLGIHPNDGKTIFIGWDGFLLAGARGESEAARKVFAYLLRAERAGRIAGGALSIAKGRESRLREAERVVNIASKYSKLPPALQKKVGLYLDDILDTALTDHQLKLFDRDGE
jgi:hypothetical protein